MKTSIKAILDNIVCAEEFLDEDAINEFEDIIMNSKNVFVTGAGRSGLAAKAFAMRLMHLGISSYVVGETILIDHDVSIAAKDHSTISAENNNVIFNVSSNAKLTLSNLNLTNANGVKGGAIYNNGVLVLNNCTFVNNKATFGGAIYNNGTMILNNCTFEFNIASVSGGAIYNLQDDLTIHDSTFIGNYAKIKKGIKQ